MGEPLHSFVVVAKKPGRRIPPEVLALLRQRDLADLRFAPEDHLFWTDERGGVCFAGWQTATAAFGLGSHWHADAQGVTAFSGRLWPKGGMWSAAESWASQLDDAWRRNGVVDTGQRFDGIYTAVSLASSGEGTIVNDPLSIALLYRAETDDFVAFSSTANLAARVAAPPGREPDRDPFGVAWLPFLGNIVGDSTGYERTKVLPVGALVDIGPAWGSRVRFSNATPWTTPSSSLPDDEDGLVDLVHHGLASSVQSIAHLRAERRFADITGGKDSRLILALLLEAGLHDQFTFRTIGSDFTPDAVVGAEIAARFGLRHERVVPTPMDHSVFGRRLGAHVFQTSGMFNALDLKGATAIAQTPTIVGLFGEIMRTHFSHYPFIESTNELWERFRRASSLDAPSILRPEVRARCLDTLREELVERLDDGSSTPQDRLDLFYVRHRVRRWSGTAEELGDSGRVFPLYSLLGFQAAFALGPARRRNELLHFEVTKKACPELAKMHFANSAWPEALFPRGHDQANEYRVAPFTYAGAAPVRWQAVRLEENRAVLEAYLLDEPSSPVFEILDRKKIVKVVRGPPPADVGRLVQLYGALTAAVWLGRHETTARFGAAPPDEPAMPRRGVRGPSTTRRASVLVGRLGRRSTDFLRKSRSNRTPPTEPPSARRECSRRGRRV